MGESLCMADMLTCGVFCEYRDVCKTIEDFVADVDHLADEVEFMSGWRGEPERHQTGEDVVLASVYDWLACSS